MSSSSSRDAALCAGWALVEGLSIAAVLVAVTATLPADAPRLAATPLLALMIAAALAGRACAQIRVHPPLGRLLALPAGLALALGWTRFSTPAAASATTITSLGLLALLVAGRGLFLGSQPPARAALMRAFVRGIVVLMLLFGLLAVAGVAIEPSLRARLRGLVLGYFVVAPLTVALAQRRELGRARGVRAAVSPSWLLAVLLPIASALAIAMLASRGADGLRATSRYAARVLDGALGLSVQAVTAAARSLVLLLTWLAALFPAAGSHDAPPAPAASPLSSEPLRVALGPPPPLTVVQHDVAAAVLLVTATLFVALYVGKLLAAAPDPDDAFGADEERSSLWSWKLFAQQARSLLRTLLSRARASHGQSGSRSSLAHEPAATDVSDVRGVYRALLRWARARGCARTPTTTPHELAAQLRCSDAQRHHLAAITELYAEARYGDREPSAAHLVDARAHLDALTASADPAREADPARTRPDGR